MTEIEKTRMTKEELVAELKDQHGIDVAELEQRAAIYPRYHAAVQMIGEACARAARVIRGRGGRR